MIYHGTISIGPYHDILWYNMVKTTPWYKQYNMVYHGPITIPLYIMIQYMSLYSMLQVLHHDIPW